MPKPTFGPADYDNPDAPGDERLLRADHPAVRDLSYDEGRARQYLDLWKQALVEPALDPGAGGGAPTTSGGAAPGASLQLFVKEQPRGRGYVCDFVYQAPDLPIAVYGTLVNEGHGLMVNELELWRGGVLGLWEYRDAWGDYVGPDPAAPRPDAEVDADGAAAEGAGGDDEADGGHSAYPGITSSLLRRIPLGRIVAAAQQTLAERSWVTEGVQFLPGGVLAADALPAATRSLLEHAADQAAPRRRGRPPLADEFLAQVARAYLKEAPAGTGLIRRLAERFGRPEATVRDWVAAARERGYLSPARPGRRGAAPGPRLRRRAAERDDGGR